MTFNLRFAQKEVVCDLVFRWRVQIYISFMVVKGCGMVHILMHLGYGQVISAATTVLTFVIIVHFELFLEVSSALRLLVLVGTCSGGFDRVLEPGAHNNGAWTADVLVLRFGILGGEKFLG